MDSEATDNDNNAQQNSATKPIKKRQKKKKTQSKKDEENYISKSPLMYDEKTNPCVKEEKLSAKCMYLNNYDKTQCADAFLNYRECTKFWRWVRVHRFWHNEHPLLPETEEERQKIKEEYWKIEREKYQVMMESMNQNSKQSQSGNKST